MNRLNFTLLFIVAFLASHATQWTVSNRTDLPVNPGQFSSIQAAINAAGVGDTILVAGSYTSYDNSITVTKHLVLLGAGYNPDEENPLPSVLNTVNVNSSASGSTIMGFQISSPLYMNSGGVYSNITFSRNYFSYLGYEFLIGDSTVNLLICANIFNGDIWLPSSGQNNLKILNCVFTGLNPLYLNGNVGNNCPAILFAHNLWIDGSSTVPLISNSWASMTAVGRYKNMVIQDNIFYNTNGGVDTTGGVYYNYTYNNNITYSGAALPELPSPTCVGSGNFNNINPQLVSIFNTTYTLNFNLDNLRLLSTSPAKNAGTDGTDIGPTGGLYPIYKSTNRVLTGEPPIPEVKSMDFTGNSSVQPGGSLTLQIKATKIN